LDWTLAIKRNREQLKDIVLSLFVLAKMRIGGSLFILPRSTFSMVMLVLRPAESAVRRLILIAAHNLTLNPRALRDFVILGPRPEDPVGTMPDGIIPARAFKLFDPLKHFDPESFWDVQTNWESGYGLTASVNPSHDTALDHQPIDAQHIGQRLNALFRALDNLPFQARRLVRWQFKRDAMLKAHRPTRMSPMRPGLPPGWRERKIHEIDDVLRECHGLAHDRLNEPNTS
jgi:hypothetical protein